MLANNAMTTLLGVITSIALQLKAMTLLSAVATIRLPQQGQGTVEPPTPAAAAI